MNVLLIFLILGIFAKPNERYTCSQCRKSYKRRNTLTRHLKLECGQEPGYVCNLCPYVTKRKYSLDIHLKSQHSFLN